MKAQVFVLEALFLLVFVPMTLLGQVIDSFDDGEFTSNPTWTGTDSTWIIVTSSDVAVGASNSFTLRLNKLSSVVGTQYLSLQRTDTWGGSQAWSFWMGRRAQPATAQNRSIVWLWANEADLSSVTVDGYRVRFGDDSGDDEIVLQRVDNGAASDILTSSGAVTNGLTDIGFMVRVTRTTGSVWTLYTSTLPTSNGTGAIATDVPTAANTSINQGSVSDATYSDFSNGYFGFMAIHTSGPDPRKGAEFDQLFFEANSDAVLPIQLSSFSASVIRDNPARPQAGWDVEITWRTISETNNYGFEIQRRRVHSGFPPLAGAPSAQNNSHLISHIPNPSWTTISFVEGHGTTLTPQFYSYVDRAVPFGNYFYRIKQIDLDGKSEIFPETEVSVGVRPDKLVLAQNYPNPFNPTTTIEFVVPQSGFTTLKVYNVLGQEVARLFEGNAEASTIHTARFDAANFGSGVYFYRLMSGIRIETRRMMLIK